VQLRSESYSPLPPRTEPVEQCATSGVLVGLLSGVTAEDPARESRGHLVVQRRYTEDWVLQRGYQQHRRTSSSWCSESSQDLEEEAGQSDAASRIRAHRRDISNAKTITPADFQQSRSGTFLSVPGAVLSSDHESVLSGVTGITGRYRTAPQSLADFPMDCTMDLPKLPTVPSRWADLTPSPVEDKTANGFKMDPPTQPEAMSTPKVNGAVANYLLSAPKSTPTTRTSTPGSRKSIKCHGRNVIIQLPSEVQFGLPGGPPMPLSQEEVEKRMKQWVEQGYSLEIGGEGDCREIYPEGRIGKVDSSDIFVSIPDPRGMFILLHTVSLSGSGHRIFYLES
jgi:hypothetical protein